LPTDPHGLANQLGTFVVIVALAAAAGVRLWRTGERALLANLAVPVFGTYLALVLARFYVQPRFASYLLFHVVVLLAIGAQAVWDALRRVTAARAVAAVALSAVALVGSARIVDLVQAQANLPWENNRFVAEVAQSTGLGKIYTDTTHPVPFYYYLGRD